MRPPRPRCWRRSRRTPRWRTPWRRRSSRRGPGRRGPSSRVRGRPRRPGRRWPRRARRRAGTRCPPRRAPARAAVSPFGHRPPDEGSRVAMFSRSGCSLTPMTTTADPAAPDRAHRLPRHVEPLRYGLTLTPDLEQATFTGTAEIELVVHEPTREIVCNAVELAITEASLLTGGPGDVGGRGLPRRGGGAGHLLVRLGRARGTGHPPLLVRRDPQRQAPRLLPQHLHRPVGCHPDAGHHADGGDRRPPRLPLLGRAGPQGGLRHHPGGRRGVGGLLQLAGAR